MKHLIFGLFLMGAMVGCAPIYSTSYTYKPPKSEMGRICLAQCMQTKNSCNQLCAIRNENCRAQAKQEAISQYQIYVDKRLAERKPVKKRLEDFDYGYSSCRNSDCNCDSDYNLCYQNCGGIVTPHQVCTAFCGK